MGTGTIVGGCVNWPSFLVENLIEFLWLEKYISIKLDVPVLYRNAYKGDFKKCVEKIELIKIIRGRRCGTAG